jgi:hypothetical protein
MFLFQISSYSDPALDAEAAELLRQRLETHSRRAMPGMWSCTDRLNAYAAKGPGRETRQTRYRVFGVLLLALGIFTLVPGLMEPQTPALIGAGAFALLAGVFAFSLTRKRTPAKAPAACKKEAQTLLARLRTMDWAKDPVQVSFDEAGMTFCSGETKQLVPCNEIKSVFETEHLWLLIYDEEKALLLQKRDCISGNAAEFFPCLTQTIADAQ